MKSHLIKSLEIRGLWGTHDFKWDCNSDVNILFGENGAGKSTILRILNTQFTNEIIREKVPKYEYVRITDLTGRVVSAYASPENNLIIGDEKVLPGIKVDYINTFDLGVKDLMNKSLLDYQLEVAIRKYIVYNSDLFIKVSTNQLPKNTAFKNQQFLFKQIDDLFKSKKLDRSTGDIKFILESGQVLTVSDLSSGEKQMLLLLITVYIQDGEPSILLMDEPEISLHIRWQHELIGILRRLNPNCQLFIVTHSPSIFNDGHREKVFFMEDLIKKREPVA